MRGEIKEQMQEELRAMRAEILAELKMQQAPDLNSLGFRRSSQHSNAVTTSSLDSIQVISPCYLTCKVGEEHIKMANTRVWPRKPDELIHCVPMLEDHMKVQYIDQDDSMPDSASNEVAESIHRKALISKKKLANVGPEFGALHERVMREPPDKNEFILKIKEGVFLPQSMLINLAFNDLTDLVKQDMLDVSIIIIWVIFMKRHATDLGREGDVGFLNPSMISKLLFDTDKEAASSYLLESLKNMQLKKFVLLPYIQDAHWVLLIFVLRDNMVYVIDSLERKEPKEPNYDIMWHFKDIFESYVEAGGVHKEGSTECE